MKYTLKTSQWFKSYRLRYMEGEGDGEGDGEGGDPTPVPKSTPGEWDGKFTEAQQKKIDEVVSKRFAKEKKEKEELIGQLNVLKQSANLTEEEKNGLAGKIDELQNSLMSEQERAAKERAKLENKFKSDLDLTSKERDTWKTRYETTLIERAITDAAVEYKAENATQLRMMFRGATRLTEDSSDDGKPTGRFIPTMKFIGLEEDGKTQSEMELPVADAIKKLKEDGLNDNLFQHSGTPGTGRLPSGGSGGKGRRNGEMPLREHYATGGEYSRAYQKYRDTYNVDGTLKKKAQS